MLKISALGSGSAGNALIIAAGEQSIIIDIGFSRRELVRRMAVLGLRRETLCAALITHEHDDHIRGCRVFCDECSLPLCATARTAAELRRRGQLPERVKLFEPGSAFEISAFHIEPFSVQHDAVDPVGFIVRCGDYKIGVATDLGVITNLVRARLRGCDALVLESNYDENMLRDSRRPLQLKRRISSQIGHLANRCACAALADLLTDRTRLLLLAHVSRDCNTPELAAESCRSRLRELGREDVELGVIPQSEPFGTYIFEAGRPVLQKG